MFLYLFLLKHTESNKRSRINFARDGDVNMGCCDVKDVRPYSVFVLVLLLLAYLLNQLDRYMLAITVKPMAQDVHFGDHDCMVNTSFTDDEVGGIKCNAKNETRLVRNIYHSLDQITKTNIG